MWIRDVRKQGSKTEVDLFCFRSKCLRKHSAHGPTLMCAPLARHLVGTNSKGRSHVERIFDTPARNLHSNIAHGNVPRLNAVPLVPLFVLGQDFKRKLSQSTHAISRECSRRQAHTMATTPQSNQGVSYQQECAATGKGIIMYNWAPLHGLESN